MSMTHARKAATKNTAAAKMHHRTVHSARKQEQVRIMAARLRLTTDRRLNKTTPEWVRELAKKPL